MRSILSSLILFALSMPAFAEESVPEPQTMALIAMGVAVAFLVSRRKKK